VKASIDIAHTQEAFQLGSCGGELCILQSINVLVMHVQSPRVDDVSKVLDFVGEPRALFQFQRSSGVVEAVRDRVHVLNVFSASRTR